jgi:hypothetical protein
MARLGTWAKATGGAALAALTHSMPLLIMVTAGFGLACLVVLVWTLSDDQRPQRLNLLLRGSWLPHPRTEPDPASPDPAEAGAGPATAAGSDPALNPQTIGYAANLREAGRPDLAAGLLQPAPQQTSAAEHEHGAATRPQS